MTGGDYPTDNGYGVKFRFLADSTSYKPFMDATISSTIGQWQCEWIVVGNFTWAIDVLPPFTLTVANAINSIPQIGIVHGASQNLVYTMSPVMQVGDPDVTITLTSSLPGLVVTPSVLTFTATGPSSLISVLTADASTGETNAAYIKAVSSDPLRAILPITVNGTEVAIRSRYYTTSRVQLDYYSPGVTPKDLFYIEVEPPRSFTMTLTAQSYK